MTTATELAIEAHLGVWRYISTRKWDVRWGGPAKLRGAGAVTDRWDKVIYLDREKALSNRRFTVEYRLPHEFGHVLDYLARQPSSYLARPLGIDRAACQEALGEAVAYRLRRTKKTQKRILDVIRWRLQQNRRGKGYNWSSVTHPATMEMARLLIYGEPVRFSAGGKGVMDPEHSSKYWTWVLDTYVRTEDKWILVPKIN